MTDYSKLIARVRSPFALTERDAQEIADALEAQAKEISQYEVDVNEALLDCKSLRARNVELEKRKKHLEEMFHDWRDEARKASARIAELEAALGEAEKTLILASDILSDVPSIRNLLNGKKWGQSTLKKIHAALKGEK